MLCPECENRYDTCTRCGGTGQVPNVTPSLQAVPETPEAVVEEGPYIEITFRDALGRVEFPLRATGSAFNTALKTVGYRIEKIQ